MKAILGKQLHSSKISRSAISICISNFIVSGICNLGRDTKIYIFTVVMLNYP